MYQQQQQPRLPVPRNLTIAVTVLVGLIIVVALVFGFAAACKSFGRYQSRADAGNRVKISSIEIRNQAQRIVVEKQRAQIRFQRAVGIREAQDEIAKTLTPLYVQFEMVDAMRQIAQSGRNNSTIFIPSGASGIPLVSTVPGAIGPAQAVKP